MSTIQDTDPYDPNFQRGKTYSMNLRHVQQSLKDSELGQIAQDRHMNPVKSNQVFPNSASQTIKVSSIPPHQSYLNIQGDEANGQDTTLNPGSQTDEHPPSPPPPRRVTVKSPREDRPQSTNSTQKRQNAQSQLLISFMMKPPSLRTDAEIQEFIKRSKVESSSEFKLFSYFKEMQLTDQQMGKILKKMTYEFHRAGKDVFQHGDMGDKFYMIIAGGVSIHIPQNFVKKKSKVITEGEGMNKLDKMMTKILNKKDSKIKSQQTTKKEKKKSSEHVVPSGPSSHQQTPRRSKVSDKTTSDFNQEQQELLKQATLAARNTKNKQSQFSQMSQIKESNLSQGSSPNKDEVRPFAPEVFQLDKNDMNKSVKSISISKSYVDSNELEEMQEQTKFINAPQPIRTMGKATTFKARSPDVSQTERRVTKKATIRNPLEDNLKRERTGSSGDRANLEIKKKITFLDAPDIFPKSPNTKVNQSQNLQPNQEVRDSKNTISKLIDRGGAQSCTNVSGIMRQLESPSSSSAYKPRLSADKSNIQISHRENLNLTKKSQNSYSPSPANISNVSVNEETQTKVNFAENTSSASRESSSIISSRSQDKGAKWLKVAERWSGEIFGELALISNKPRAATITCVTDCHFACLDRRSFQIIKQNTEKALNKKIESIRNIPFFDNMSKVALMKYQNYFRQINFIRGSLVQQEGRPMTDLYLILEGEFELSRTLQFMKNSNSVNLKSKQSLKKFLPKALQDSGSKAGKVKERQPFDAVERLQVAIVGPYSFQGLEEATQSKDFCLNTIRCVSQRGKALAIDREHFEIIMKQKDSEILRNLTHLSLLNELKTLDMIRVRGILKDKVNDLTFLEDGRAVNPKHVRPIDLELKYMEEIRRQYYPNGSEPEIETFHIEPPEAAEKEKAAEEKAGEAPPREPTKMKKTIEIQSTNIQELRAATIAAMKGRDHSDNSRKPCLRHVGSTPESQGSQVRVVVYAKKSEESESPKRQDIPNQTTLEFHIQKQIANLTKERPNVRSSALAKRKKLLEQKPRQKTMPISFSLRKRSKEGQVLTPTRSLSPHELEALSQQRIVEQTKLVSSAIDAQMQILRQNNNIINNMSQTEPTKRSALSKTFALNPPQPEPPQESRPYNQRLFNLRIGRHGSSGREDEPPQHLASITEVPRIPNAMLPHPNRLMMEDSEVSFAKQGTGLSLGLIKRASQQRSIQPVNGYFGGSQKKYDSNVSLSDEAYTPYINQDSLGHFSNALKSREQMLQHQAKKLNKNSSSGSIKQNPHDNSINFRSQITFDQLQKQESINSKAEFITFDLNMRKTISGFGGTQSGGKQVEPPTGGIKESEDEDNSKEITSPLPLPLPKKESLPAKTPEGISRELVTSKDLPVEPSRTSRVDQLSASKIESPADGVPYGKSQRTMSLSQTEEGTHKSAKSNRRVLSKYSNQQSSRILKPSESLPAIDGANEKEGEQQDAMIVNSNESSQILIQKLTDARKEIEATYKERSNAKQQFTQMSSNPESGDETSKPGATSQNQMMSMHSSMELLHHDPSQNKITDSGRPGESAGFHLKTTSNDRFDPYTDTKGKDFKSFDTSMKPTIEENSPAGKKGMKLYQTLSKSQSRGLKMIPSTNFNQLILYTLSNKNHPQPVPSKPNQFHSKLHKKTQSTNQRYGSGFLQPVRGGLDSSGGPGTPSGNYKNRFTASQQVFNASLYTSSQLQAMKNHITQSGFNSKRGSTNSTNQYTTDKNTNSIQVFAQSFNQQAFANSSLMFHPPGHSKKVTLQSGAASKMQGSPRGSTGHESKKSHKRGGPRNNPSRAGARGSGSKAGSRAGSRAGSSMFKKGGRASTVAGIRLSVTHGKGSNTGSRKLLTRISRGSHSQVSNSLERLPHDSEGSQEPPQLQMQSAAGMNIHNIIVRSNTNKKKKKMKEQVEKNQNLSNALSAIMLSNSFINSDTEPARTTLRPGASTFADQFRAEQNMSREKLVRNMPINERAKTGGRSMGHKKLRDNFAKKNQSIHELIMKQEQVKNMNFLQLRNIQQQFKRPSVGPIFSQQRHNAAKTLKKHISSHKIRDRVSSYQYQPSEFRPSNITESIEGSRMNITTHPNQNTTMNNQATTPMVSVSASAQKQLVNIWTKHVNLANNERINSSLYDTRGLMDTSDPMSQQRNSTNQI